MNQPNTTTPDPNIEREVLLHEHEELVQLFIHEDSLAWQLHFALLAGNAGIITGAYSLGLLDPKPLTLVHRITLASVLGVGILLNIVGYFILQRSKLHRLARLFRAYAIEARLMALGAPVATFTSAEKNLFHRLMLEQDGINTRPLTYRERVVALNFDFLLIVVAALSLVAFVWLLSGRPGL